MYFFQFKNNGVIKHVIQAPTRADALIRLCSLVGYKTTWDHIGASVSVISCEYQEKQSSTRQAKDPSGNDIIWHMFFVDENNKAMALIEQAGMVRTCLATWVQFTDYLPSEV